jgi:hypothetical protein
MTQPILFATPSFSTIIQGAFLGLFIIFCFTVFTVGFTAKRMQIFGASYAKAFLAVALTNIISLPGLLVMGSMGIPPLLALFLVVTLLPIVIYKLVFSINMMQAFGVCWFPSSSRPWWDFSSDSWASSASRPFSAQEARHPPL